MRDRYLGCCQVFTQQRAYLRQLTFADLLELIVVIEQAQAHRALRPQTVGKPQLESLDGGELIQDKRIRPAYRLCVAQSKLVLENRRLRVAQHLSAPTLLRRARNHGLTSFTRNV